MKLSVIIPVYNAEKYLRECVDSVLEQTEKDLEIILVNDGSPDSSGAIIAEYAARYPDKVSAITVENGGQGRARNFGIAAAISTVVIIQGVKNFPNVYDHVFHLLAMYLSKLTLFQDDADDFNNLFGIHVLTSLK